MKTYYFRLFIDLSLLLRKGCTEKNYRNKFHRATAFYPFLSRQFGSQIKGTVIKITSIVDFEMRLLCRLQLIVSSSS